MATIEALEARKRLRSPDVEQLPPAKKKKTSTKDCYRPPPFWDTLSTIWLTRGALGEFERRNITTTRPLNYIPTPAVEAPTGAIALRLKMFTRRGGPDLSHLRGGVTAYRNARNLAKEQRDILMAQANEVAARQIYAVSPPTQPPVGKPGDPGDQVRDGISSDAEEEIG